jgi:hypothetical protein
VVVPPSRKSRNDRFHLVVMGKLGWTAIFVLGAALAADQYWNFGRYTDAAIAMLRAIQRSFGF